MSNLIERLAHTKRLQRERFTQCPILGCLFASLTVPQNRSPHEAPLKQALAIKQKINIKTGLFRNDRCDSQTFLAMHS